MTLFQDQRLRLWLNRSHSREIRLSACELVSCQLKSWLHSGLFSERIILKCPVKLRKILEQFTFAWGNERILWFVKCTSHFSMTLTHRYLSESPGAKTLKWVSWFTSRSESLLNTQSRLHLTSNMSVVEYRMLRLVYDRSLRGILKLITLINHGSIFSRLNPNLLNWQLSSRWIEVMGCLILNSQMAEILWNKHGRVLLVFGT